MKLKLISKKPEEADAYSFYLKPEESIAWAAGQYLHYTFPHPHPDDRGDERWFTISAAPFEKSVRITTRIFPHKRSSFKQALFALNEGDEIEAEKPGGKFTMVEGAKKHVFVSGGIGITPYRSMLVQLDHDGADINVDLLYANRDDNLVFGDELEALAKKHPGLVIKKFIGDHKITDDDLKPYVDESGTVIYLSGPEPMVESFKERLTKMGLPEDRLKTDYFPGYPEDLS